jgi:Rrf2 family protein
MALGREDVLALDVVVDIAKRGRSKARDIALRQDLHPRYLDRLLQKLARKKILSSDRGANGGYRLARDACLIRASDVVRAARRKPSVRRKAQSCSAVKRLIEQLESRTFSSLHDITIEMLAYEAGRLSGGDSTAVDLMALG